MKTLLTTALLYTICIACFAQSPRKLQQNPNFQLEIELPSQVLLPENYNANKKYPVVIFLPFAGGSGYDLFNGYAFQSDVQPASNQMTSGNMIQVDLQYLIDSLGRMPTNEEVEVYMDKLMETQIAEEEQKQEEISDGRTNAMLTSLIKGLFKNNSEAKTFIAMIPHDAGSTKDHSWEGFEVAIYRYENRILKDLEIFGEKYNFDKSKVVLIGFSFGGDLGWAISQRYPETFKGAIVMGSRCGYTEKGATERQVKNDFRYFIGMGEYEQEVRMKGAKNAKNALTKAGVKHQFQIVAGEEHSPIHFSQLKDALNFILFE